uniref:Uncharacterized protein n=1 Tax=Anguilla anguilla TaxID=7936 RepID=A0A0E9VW92_ANGAN
MLQHRTSCFRLDKCVLFCVVYTTALCLLIPYTESKRFLSGSILPPEVLCQEHCR